MTDPKRVHVDVFIITGDRPKPGDFIEYAMAAAEALMNADSKESKQAAISIKVLADFAQALSNPFEKYCNAVVKALKGEPCDCDVCKANLKPEVN